MNRASVLLAAALLTLAACENNLTPPRPPPGAGSLRLTVAAAAPNPARVGHTVSFEISGSTPLLTCTAAVAGLDAPCLVLAEGTCLCRFNVTDSVPAGSVTVTASASATVGTATGSGTLQVDKAAPVVDAAKITIVRKPAGEADAIALAPHAVKDEGEDYAGRAVVAVRAWAAAEGGEPLATLVPAADGTWPETPLAAPAARVWLSAVDLPGNESLRVEAVNGVDTAGPNVAGAEVVITRRPVGEVDTIQGLAGALDDGSPGRVVSVELWDAAVEGQSIGIVAVAADGSFAEREVGTADRSPAIVWVQGKDKCGLVGPRVAARTGADETGPQGDDTRIELFRRPLGAVDGVRGTAGAFTDTVGQSVRVFVFDAELGGEAIGDGPIEADGSFAEIPVGTASDAPRSVWLEALDKAGNTGPRVEVVVGRDVLPPEVDTAAVAITRRPLGLRDDVTFPEGALSDATSAVRSLILWDAAQGGTPLATGAPDAAGAFEALPFGTTTRAPGRVWIEAFDKCGNGGVRVELTHGRDVAPPRIDATLLHLERRPVGEPDTFVVGPGAVSPDEAVASLVLWDASSGGTILATLAPDDSGSFPIAAIGTAQLAPPRAWVEATDKCGNTTSRLEVEDGSASEGPEGDGDRLVLHRRAKGALDGLEGLADAFAGTCAPASITAWESAIGGRAIGARPVDANRSFSELPVGTLTSAPPRVWVKAIDKCGLAGPRVEALVGRSTEGPLADGTRLVLDRRGQGTADAVHGEPAAISGACAQEVDAFDALTGGTKLGTSAVATDGSFAEIAVGTTSSSLARVWLQARDKCGRTGIRTEALVGRELDAPAIDGARLVIGREAFGSRDNVRGVPGAVRGECALTLELFDVATAGTALATTEVAADGSFAPVSVGTATLAPTRVWAEARGKCGRRASRVEALAGSAAGPPSLEQTATRIVRRGWGAVDALAGTPHAIRSACAARAQLYTSASGGTGTSVAVALDGSLEELPVGTATLAPAQIWVEPSDKCGQTGLRTEVLAGAAPAPPLVDGSRLTIARRDLTAKDGVSGASGAVAAVCATTVRAWDGPATGTSLGTADVAADGSFSEVTFGSPTASAARVYVEAFDKCGHAATSRVEAAIGKDLQAPIVDANLVTWRERLPGQVDTLVSLPGGVTDPDGFVTDLRLFDAPLNGTQIGGVLAPTVLGSVPETAVGDTALPAVWAVAKDKTGHSSPATLVRLVAVRTTAGHVPYSTDGRVALHAFPAENPRSDPAQGPLSGPEGSVSENTAASAADAQVVTNSVSGLSATTAWAALALPEVGVGEPFSALYDPVRGRLVVSDFVYPDDRLDAFDGSAWATLGNAPFGYLTQYMTTLAWDFSSARFLMVSTQDTENYPPLANAGTFVSATGASWAHLPSAQTPAFAFDGNNSGGLRAVRLVGDPITKHTLAFVHTTNLSAALESWEFNGAEWTKVVPAHPAPTLGTDARFTVGYAGRGRVVLHAGISGATWLFANHDWSQISIGPAPRYGVCSLTYDLARDKVLTLCEGGEHPWGGTWNDEPVAATLTGSTWTTVATALPRLYRGRLAYAPALGRNLVAGLTTAPSGYRYSQTFAESANLNAHGRYAAQQFTLTLDPARTYSSVTITWVGAGSGASGNGAELYAWSWTQDKWVALGTQAAAATDSAAARTITATLPGALSQYLRDGTVRFVAHTSSPSAAPPATTAATLVTDAVEIAGTYAAP